MFKLSITSKMCMLLVIVEYQLPTRFVS
jgi:hypothetical protein